MAILQSTANRFRAAMAAREEEAANELVQTYGSIYGQLEISLNDITRRIALAEQQGQPVSLGWLYQQTRLLELTRMVEAQISQFALYATSRIAATQLLAVQQAQHDSYALTLDSIGPIKEGVIPTNFLRFNPDVVAKFVGRASDGSPLNTLLKDLAGEQVEKLKSVFVDGIVRGLNPVTVAKTMSKEFEVPLQRAMTVSRTEVLNAYRDTNTDFFRENSRVVIRWRWVCAHQDRTCAMCLAMDGREFPIQIDMGTHPNCRCTLIPVTRTWEELGYKSAGSRETRARKTQSGEDWFANQNDATQRKILGPAKLKLYKEGDLTLQDVVGYKDDTQWGSQRWERSLKQIDAGDFTPPPSQVGTYAGN